MSANIIVYNKTGKLTALVGVMGGLETTPEEAEEQVGRYLRRYDPPYLVVVARDKIYFWHDPAHNPRPVADLTNDSSSLPEFARSIGFADAIYYGDLEYAA